MEVVSLDDFKALEKRLESKLEFIANLLLQGQSNNVIKKMLLNIKDVSEEYRQSAYTQRLARNSGELPYINNSKEIQYQRTDVESWIESKTIK